MMFEEVVVVCDGAKADVLCSVADFVGGARAFRGCWRIDIRSSTRRAEAMGRVAGWEGRDRARERERESRTTSAGSSSGASTVCGNGQE